MDFTSNFLKEPTLIDEKLLYNNILSQGPKGEAGRIFKDQGVEYDKVMCLRLEFLEILQIQNLTSMTSLTILQLSNNVIEKIENLESLINLKKLDLSFNRIAKIQNLDQLVNLEILSLFENKISVLENLENLQALSVFSIGNNELADKENILFLRRLGNLQSLNLDGNPVSDEENFFELVCCFLPKLVYYGYKLISDHQRLEAMQLLRDDLKRFEEMELHNNASRKALEQEAMQELMDNEAFVEGVTRLFDEMFVNDPDGNTLLQLPDIYDFYNEFKKEFCQITDDFQRLAREEAQTRINEVSEYQIIVKKGINNAYSESRKITEGFLEEKSLLFEKFKTLSAAYKRRMINKDELSSLLQVIHEELEKLCLSAWHELMAKELNIYDNLEKMNNEFKRDITLKVNSFIETAQATFTKLRNLQENYQKDSAEEANKFFATLAAAANDNAYIGLSPELMSLLDDQEILTSALSGSHDAHSLAIDSREDKLMSAARRWNAELIDKMVEAEIERNRSKVLEINHFLDSQRVELTNTEEQMNQLLQREESFNNGDEANEEVE